MHNGLLEMSIVGFDVVGVWGKSGICYITQTCLRKPHALSFRGKESTNENDFAQLQQPELLGTTENELGLRKWLEDQGHTLVTTSDKEGENSTFDKELVDAEIIITTPYVITPYFLALQTRTESGNHTCPPREKRMHWS
jgi:hypothetical protein